MFIVGTYDISSEAFSHVEHAPLTFKSSLSERTTLFWQLVDVLL